MMKSTFAITTRAILAIALTANLWATMGSSEFLEVDYLPDAGVTALATATAPAVTTLAQRMANNFALMPNASGETLMPVGTVCDGVEIIDGVMTVLFTFPTDVNPSQITEERVVSAAGVLRQSFDEPANLTGMNLMARVASGEYAPIIDFLPPIPPVSSENDDWFEPGGPGPQPRPIVPIGPSTNNITGQGPIGTSGQPQGALSGRVVYTYGGHGWVWRDPGWGLQRGILDNFNEDLGNGDQVYFFVQYLFNAGATVVPFRPVGHQPNAVVMDNTSAGVTWTGTWTDSTSTTYFGPTSPGTVPYRWANTTVGGETNFATYTPNIPMAGFYPVYAWARYGSDRVNQLYRIRHTGGEAQVRVNHREVGMGWVWLGSYYFDAGSNPSTGSVVISDQVSSGSGVIIADAIRFGNGAGESYGGGRTVSGYLRETESTRYWIQSAIGNPDAPNIYDASGTDEADSWYAPPRMAARMRRDDGQGYNNDIYLGWHSNGSLNHTARGSVGLISSSSPTTNQAAFAALLSNEIDADCLIEDANWEYAWHDRASATYTGGYSEIANSNLGGEMCGSIIEVAFHDNVEDVSLLKDPKARGVIGRACYQAIVRYFNTYDSNPLAFLPEPPVNVRAVNDGLGGVTVSWSPEPSGGAGGQTATGYVVYHSPNGLGFGNGVATTSTSTTINGLTPGEIHYFRVAATNAGGESLPSEVVAVRLTYYFTPQVLIVNGYDRIDRFNNVLESPPFSGSAERLFVWLNNSYDYVIAHGEAVAAAERYFDSTSNEAVIANQIALDDYDTVVWICGEESTGDSTFNSTEQSRVTSYLANGGTLFVSGAEIGWDLEARGNGASFYNGTLRTDYVLDDAGTYTVAGGTSIFSGLGSFTFDNGTSVYDVDYPDTLAGTGGSIVCMTYSGGAGAAIQYPSGTTNGEIVMLGLPFETITSESARNQIMDAALDFFGVSTSPDVPVGPSGILFE